MPHFWGSRCFCHSRVPIQPQSTTALKLTRGNHKVLKIRRKALTDRFCARPEMTPGTPPRIIFLLVAPAACSLSAEKDTRVVGGWDHRWTGWEEAHRWLPRFVEAMPLSGFPAKHGSCHPCPDQQLPIRKEQSPDQYRHCQAWQSQPFLSELSWTKMLRNSVLELKMCASLKSHYLAHC